MGCNTSTEQLQAVPSVVNNENYENYVNSEIKDAADGEYLALDKKISNLNYTKSCDIKNLTSNICSENNEQEDEERAAVKIQATFRGHKVRTSMKQGDKSTAMENNCKDNKATEAEGSSVAQAAATTPDDPTKEELEAEFDPNNKELCNAATRIQATFRGHLQRKLAAAEIKDDADLEEITKKVAEELDIDLTDPELNKAATKIQASFRGHKTRRETAE